MNPYQLLRTVRGYLADDYIDRDIREALADLCTAYEATLPPEPLRRPTNACRVCNGHGCSACGHTGKVR